MVAAVVAIASAIIAAAPAIAVALVIGCVGWLYVRWEDAHPLDDNDDDKPP